MSENIEFLEKLLKLLRASNVAQFRGAGFEIIFKSMEAIETATPEASSPSLPPDLRTDGVTDADKILFWSAPPTADISDDPELALTDDKPL